MPGIDTPELPENNNNNRELNFDEVFNNEIKPRFKEIEASLVTPTPQNSIPDDEVMKACKKGKVIVTNTPSSETSIWIDGEELLKANIKEIRIGKAKEGLPAIWILYLLAGNLAVVVYKLTLKDGVDPLMIAWAIRLGIAKKILCSVKVEKGWESFFAPLDTFFDSSTLVDYPVLRAKEAVLVAGFHAIFSAKDKTIEEKDKANADLEKNLQSKTDEINDLRKKNEYKDDEKRLLVKIIWSTWGIFAVLALTVIILEAI